MSTPNASATAKVALPKGQKIFLGVLAALLVAALITWALWPNGETTDSITAVVTDTVATDTVAQVTPTPQPAPPATKPGDTTAVQPTPAPPAPAGGTPATPALQPQPGGSGNSGQGGGATGKAGSATTATTVKDTVNVRNQASKSGAINAQLQPGDTIQPIGISQDGKWIETPTGWISKGLVANVPTGLTVRSTIYTNPPMQSPSKNGKDPAGFVTVHRSSGSDWE